MLGTPNEHIWQDVYQLPNFKDTFPKWRVSNNEKLWESCPNFRQNPEAFDLLVQMVRLEPSKRITVKAALNHPYFKEFNAEEFNTEPIKTPAAKVKLGIQAESNTNSNPMTRTLKRRSVEGESLH